MKLTEFIENRYQELRLKQETEKNAFDAWVDSEMKAIHAWLSFYRWALKWLLFPKVICHYLSVCFGYCLPPEPVILNRLKADKLKHEEQTKNSESKGARETKDSLVPAS